MMALVPEVHLFICLDFRVAPGPLLHCLDLARAQDWQQETILICDESWKKYVNVDQPVIFIDRNELFNSDITSEQRAAYLDQLLEQLDHFEIKKVTQVGDLSWGRWLSTYFEVDQPGEITRLEINGESVSSTQLVNVITEAFALDIMAPLQATTRSSAVYMDPYDGENISPLFNQLVKNIGNIQLPPWLRIICREQDMATMSRYNLSDFLVDVCETETHLFNQSVICFSDNSLFSQTSRSYNVALFGSETDQSLFLPGDISIKANADIHFSELINILSYWKMKRLKELAFQWMNMGIEIEVLENFHSRVSKRNLLNYSSDLFHSQILVKQFLRGGDQMKKHEIFELIYRLRREVSNDPYALSFSLKILLNIVDRMIASAKCGERLFERLGSDYHRIIIGEALIEGLIEAQSTKPVTIDIHGTLKKFHNFLIQVDHFNDQAEETYYTKESA